MLFNWLPDCLACPNHEVVVFQPQTGDTPVLTPPLLLQNIFKSLRPTYYNGFLDFPPPPWTFNLPPPHLVLFDDVLYLLQPITPPKYPRHVATVYLDVSPTRRLPPLISVLPYLAVLDLLPRSLPALVVPPCMPVSTVSIFWLTSL